MQAGTRLHLASIAALSVIWTGCGIFYIFAPDTHYDMSLRIEAIGMTPDLELIAVAHRGTRSGFKSASRPSVETAYSTPRQIEAVCAEFAKKLSDWADDFDQSRFKVVDGSCGAGGTVRSGSRARLVGVARYAFGFFAESYARLRRHGRLNNCERYLQESKDNKSGVWFRVADCVLPRDAVLVTIRLTGGYVSEDWPRSNKRQ